MDWKAKAKERAAKPTGKADSGGKSKASAGGQPAAGGPTPKPRKRGNAPIAYYDSNRNCYWTKNARGEWIQFTEASLRRRLKHEVFAKVDDKEALARKLDQAMMALQLDEDVAYAGKLAGYRSGLHDVCGERILVTAGPRLLKPEPGQWPTLKAFLGELLAEDLRYFLAWLKSAVKTLYAGPPFRPGQMLAVAGPSGCGKSLLQNLITEILGGRSAKPYRYLTARTDFNSDLMQAEHLLVEDEAASTELRVRRHMGSQLKNLIANETQSLHRKSRDPLTVTPYTRVSITLNEEPENLMVLPPIDESLRDKVMLLRAFRASFPFESDDLAGRHAFRAALSQELPAFVFWLREWRIPSSLVDQRYGCKAYQEATLLQELAELAPETSLLALIDVLQIWGLDRQPWEGSSIELEERLLEKDRLGRVKELLGWRGACGTYLARLVSSLPERVTRVRHKWDGHIYTIVPPPEKFSRK